MATQKRNPSRGPVRRPANHANRRYARTSARRLRLSLTVRLLAAIVVICLAIVAWAVIARVTAPHANTSKQSFDAILILGTPADSDGNPTPELLDRITEGVREYERGVAPRLIVSGAAAHNRFVEAEVMARVAQSQGVPASRVILEPKAMDTIQNLCYASRIMREHQWRSVEVISAASHLPRAAMILERLPGPELEWRMHAAPDALTPSYYSRGASMVETLKTARYLVWTRWIENCESM